MYYSEILRLCYYKAQIDAILFPFFNPQKGLFIQKLTKNNACRPALRSKLNMKKHVHFHMFLLFSGMKSLKKVWNEQKRLKTAEKKYFDQLLGARSTQKLFRIHNS